MDEGSVTESISPITLGQALNEYLQSLKPDARSQQISLIRKYVEHAGEETPVSSLTSSRVELYAETQIKSSDPAAPERVAALKQWFQFLKKRNYTATNYGVHIRVRKVAGRQHGGGTRTVVEDAPKVEMTLEGFEALKLELEDLNARTPALVQAITLAREDKDFRENAPLEAAREALAFNDQRRKAIETTLKRAVVVERSRDDRSSVGSAVTVTRLDTGRKDTYRLVGAREANAAERKISVDSPVGRELLGRRVGEDVTVAAPSGVIQFRIEAITRD